jgi:hypothetical protein
MMRVWTLNAARAYDDSSLRLDLALRRLETMALTIPPQFTL